MSKREQKKNLNQSPTECITNLNFELDRPLMVGTVIYEKVPKFLMAVFKKGRHKSYGIASTTANVLLSRIEDLTLKSIQTTPM